MITEVVLLAASSVLAVAAGDGVRKLGRWLIDKLQLGLHVDGGLVVEPEPRRFARWELPPALPQPPFDPVAFWLFPDWSAGDNLRDPGTEPFWMRPAVEPETTTSREVVERGPYGLDIPSGGGGGQEPKSLRDLRKLIEAEDASCITSLGTAAAVCGQGALATRNSIVFPSPSNFVDENLRTWALGYISSRLQPGAVINELRVHWSHREDGWMCYWKEANGCDQMMMISSFDGPRIR